MLALQDLLGAAHRLLALDVLAGTPGELLRHEERLAHEALEAPRALHGDLVLLRQLVHPQDGDDVLEVLVALERPLHLARHVEVLIPHDARGEDGGGRGERVHGGIDPDLHDRPLEADGGVEVAERGGGCGIGVVVGGDEHRLQGGDGPLLRGGDPLLELAHLRGEGRLVAHRGRHPAQEGGDLRAGLREAEDVVDEEEDVAPLHVSEVLRHRERGQAHALAGAGRLVHLAEDHDRLVDDAGFGHLANEVVPLAGSLAHAGEDGVAAVLRGDVPDQLLDDDRLPGAGAAEDGHLPAALERGDQVHDLDPRLEDLLLGEELVEGRRVAVDGEHLLGLHRALPVDGVAQDVEDAAERLLAHRDGDGRAGIDRVEAARQPVGGGHGHRAHPVVPQVLLDLDDEGVLSLHLLAARALDLEGVVDRGKLARGELHVDDGACDLDHRSGGHWSSRAPFPCAPMASAGGGQPPRASAPEAISIISRVMVACRVLL